MAAISGAVRFRALFLFEGSPVYVSDQDDVGVVAEKRVKDWGTAELNLDGGGDALTLTLSNRLIPDVSGSRFSDRWPLADPPKGVGVIVQQSLTESPAWFLYFVGAVEEVTEVTERTVVIHVASPSAAYYRDLGEAIIRTEFPQAADNAVDKIKPIGLGMFSGFTPPLVRRRQRSTLKAGFLATDVPPFDLSVDTNETWPAAGSLEVNDEEFLYDQANVTTDDVLRITARGQNGTTATAAAIGDIAAEIAKSRWLVFDHPSKEITAVYGVSSDGEKVALDSSLFEVHLGDAEDPRTSVKLTSSKGLKVDVPSKTSSYRRIEMDAAGTFGEHTLAAIPGFSNGSRAKNPAMAAGEAAEWGGDNFAVMSRDIHDTLVVKRTKAVPDPGVPVESVRIGVEHFGLKDFGYQSTLTAEILSSASTLVVADASDLIASGAAYLLIDSELLQVLSFPDDQTIAVARGVLNTAATSHGEGERVFAALDSAFNALFPNVQVRIEDDAGVFQTLGPLTDESAVPPDVTEDAGAYTDVQAITAFHGHEVEGGVVAAGLYLTAGFDVANDDLDFIGALYVATILNVANENSNIEYPLSAQITKAYPLGSSGISFCMPAAVGSLPGALKQKIKGLRVRFAHAAAAGESSSSVRVRLWIGGEKVIDEVKSSKGEVAAGNPPDVDLITADLSAFPDGFDLKKLYQRNTLLWFSEVDGNTRLYFVGIDVVFDEQQLLGSSSDFANDRTVLTGSFDLVLLHAGTYDSGLSGGGANHVLELFDGRSWSYLLKDTSAGHVIRGEGGTKGGTVRFTSAPSGVNDVQTVGCYWSGIDAPSQGRITRVTILIDAAYKALEVAKPTIVLRDHKNNISYLPSIESTGVSDELDGQNWTRRCWRVSWKSSDLPLSVGGNVVTVRRLMRDFHVRVSATGSGDSAFYATSLDWFIEVDQATTSITNSINPDAFTRIRYFDVSPHVASFAALEGRKVALSLENASVRDEDQSKPILAARVFALFKFTATTEAELERIAVDGTGIELTDKLDALRQVLTAGYPLLSVPTDAVDESSFATAIASGALELRGVIETKQDAAGLLADLAEQAKVSFLWEGGFAKVVYKPELGSLPPVAFVFSHSAEDVLQDSVIVSYRTKDSVGNVVTVRGRRDFVKGGYELSKETENVDSQTKYGRRPHEIGADFLQTDDDCSALACQQLNYRREIETVIRWLSPPSAKSLLVRRGMIVQLSSPIASSDRLEVLGVRTLPGSVSAGIPTVEITTVLRPAEIPCPLVTVPSFGDDEGGGTGDGSSFTDDFDDDFE